MVADTLNVLGAEKEVNYEWDRPRIFHIAQQFVEYGPVQGIDLLIAFPDVERLPAVSFGKGIKHVSQLIEHEFRQMLNTAARTTGNRLTVERDHPFTDVLGEISNSFQVVGDA